MSCHEPASRGRSCRAESCRFMPRNRHLIPDILEYSRASGHSIDKVYVLLSLCLPMIGTTSYYWYQRPNLTLRQPKPHPLATSAKKGKKRRSRGCTCDLYVTNAQPTALPFYA